MNVFFVYIHHRSSNFKRQNTIDSSSIKENSARLAQNQRPASAQPKAVSSTDSKYNKIEIFLHNKKPFCLYVEVAQGGPE